MADSDAGSGIDEPTREAMRDLADVVKEAAARQPLLSGPASVQLAIKVEDARTPQEAVEMVIRKIAHVGLDTFTFAVTDMMSGTDHFVQAGQLFDLGEVQDAIKDAQGDGD